MYKDYFDCDCVSIDRGLLCFHNCTLKKDIGNFKVGGQFEFIELDHEQGVATFYNLHPNSDIPGYLSQVGQFKVSMVFKD